MAGVLASVAAYETEVRKERQLARIARAKAEGKQSGGRKPGTRVKLTMEKEKLIRQLHAQGQPSPSRPWRQAVEAESEAEALDLLAARVEGGEVTVTAVRKRPGAADAR